MTFARFLSQTQQVGLRSSQEGSPLLQASSGCRDGETLMAKHACIYTEGDSSQAGFSAALSQCDSTDVSRAMLIYISC